MIKGLWQRIRLLTAAERARWLTLVVLGAAIAALEAIGGAVVFSLIGVLSHSDRPASTLMPLLGRLVERGGTTAGATIVRIALVVAAVHVIKTAVVLAASHWQARLTETASAQLSNRLFNAYLRAPYAFHLRRGSSELISNCLDSVHLFYLTLGAAVTLLTEVFVAAALVLVVAAVVPGETIAVAAALALLLGAFVAVTRTRIRRWGQQRYELGTAVLGTVQQALAGVKEIKLLGREAYFVDRVSRDQDARARLESRQATLANSPRLVTETMFVMGMLALVLPLASSAAAGPQLLPAIGIYAYAAFRVIPAANRIMLQLSNIRYSLGSTDALCRDLETFRKAGDHPTDGVPPPLPFTRTLTLEGVSFTYPSERSPVLQDVTLEIRRGEWVGIVGHTGSGKSTLLDVLAGLLPPESGVVMADHVDVETNVAGWQRQIGYVPQSIFLLDDTLRRNITLGVHDDEVDALRLTRAVEQAQLGEFVFALRDGLETIVGERGVRLSGGERQRVAIARALYRDPAVLVFDEATAWLDTETERALARALERLHPDKTVISVAHRISTIASCDRIFVLRHGRVEACGSFTQLLAASPTFRALAAQTETDGHWLEPEAR